MTTWLGDEADKQIILDYIKAIGAGNNLQVLMTVAVAVAIDEASNSQRELQ